MNHLTDEAAAWAESGTRKRGECALRPQFAPRPVAAATFPMLNHVIAVPTQAA
jgi:hypothetical protein